LKEGDPVGLAWLHDSCGWCEYCRTGWDALCLAQRNSGYSVNGSFAEYAIGSAAYVGRLPSAWNSPGGRPTRTTVPLRRTIWIAWSKADIAEHLNPFHEA
jgi:hypothetical protein